MSNFLADAVVHADPIERLERVLLEAEAAGYGVPLETWHHFADGLVARTILIPAGTALTGAAHRFKHMVICCGDIEVTTPEGLKRLTGYHVLPATPGAKRAGRAFADTWWTTVHLNPDNERDVSKLEDTLVEQSDMLQRRRLALVSNTQPEALA